ncbi:MAG: NDP-sugar synthase, partial [Coriobacteriia bacterium]|nr:NDP-sugar synthase [Coriobacteriia bacterium]
MKAVVMAGGEGTRLRPLTSMRPKPMVPIVNQPVMEHILGLVKHHGITDVVATLAFMPQVIEDYFGDGDEWGMNITYAVEETPLGTAGSVKNAAEALTETFLVISGDALTDINLTEVIEFHRAKGAAVTIALKRVPDPLEFGVVITDEDGRIERFLEKPSWGQVFSDTINTGIYVVDPLVFDFMPENTPFDFSSDLFPILMEKGYPLYGCVVDGYWADVGSLEGYVEVHRDILDGKAMIYVPGSKTKDDFWVCPGASIDPTAEISPKAVIGANTTIRAGAKIGPYTVIGDNC